MKRDCVIVGKVLNSLCYAQANIAKCRTSAVITQDTTPAAVVPTVGTHQPIK